MWNLWKLIKGKALSDRADSILVPAMILLPVLALGIGIAVEVQKNNFVRSERINAIQDSASAAVTLTDSRGSLNWKVVDKVVNEYEHNRFGGKKFSSANNTGLQYDDTYRETAESQAYQDTTIGAGGCLVGTGDKAGDRYPQYKVTLDTGRGSTADTLGTNAKPVTVSFTRTQPTVAQLNQIAPLGAKTIYRSVTVEVIDQTPNLVMGIAGVPCQKFDLSASAVTFSADADILR